MFSVELDEAGVAGTVFSGSRIKYGMTREVRDDFMKARASCCGRIPQ